MTSFLASTRRQKLSQLFKKRGFLDLLIIGTVVVIAFVLRFINYTNIVAYPDEFTYYYRALATLSYNWAWSKQFMLDQPPIYMYVLSIITFFYNDQLNTFRLFSVIFGSLTAGMVYLLGKAIFNRLVGLLAAFFFAFSGFDILYSRLAQQEALTLFLVTATLYFFWMGVMRPQKSLKYSIAGGVFLGLAVDTKYIALIVPLTFIIFFFLMGRNWTRFRFLDKEFRSRLISREFGALLGIAFLTVLPVIIELYINGVDAIYWDVLGKFVNVSSPFYRSFSPGTIVFSALSSYTQLLTFVSSFTSSSQSVFPAYNLYSFLMVLSIFGILIYFFAAFWKKRAGETFVFVLFLVVVIFFLFYHTRFQYYQLYTFPAFPLMFARLFERSIVRFSASLARGARTVRPLVFVAFVILCLVFSTGILAGTTSAKYGHGANDDLLSFFNAIKANGNSTVTIAVTPIEGLQFVSYYLNQMNISANVITLVGIGTPSDNPNIRTLEVPIQNSTSLVSEVITVLPLSVYHPNYIVLGEDEYQTLFTTSMKLYIAQSYTPLMISSGFIIFQRVATPTSNILG